MIRVLSVLVFLVLAIAIILSSLYTVDFTDFVIVSRFGRHDRMFDGSNSTEAGLHFKWPWPIETTRSITRKLIPLEMPPAELLTRDPQKKTIDRTLTIDAIVSWRVPDTAGADRFARRVGLFEEANALLGQKISSELGSVVGGMELKDLLDHETPERVPQMRAMIRKKVMEALAAFKEDFGIDVVNFQIRRVGYPSAVRQAIYDRIISEREKKAAEYLSAGEQEAAKIRSDGEKNASEIRSTAEAGALKIRAEAEAEGDKIRNRAFREDPAFYSFLRKLEEYGKILGENKTTLFLSTKREIFDLLLSPPSVTPKSAPVPSPMTSPGSGSSPMVPMGPMSTPPANSGRGAP